MFFVLKATPKGDTMTLSVEPDWDHACFAGLPVEPHGAPDGLTPEERNDFIRTTKRMANEQSIVVVLHGPSQVQQFVGAMRHAPAPWLEFAAAFSHVAEQTGHVAAAHLWMPNFYETNYGKKVSDHIQAYIAN